MKLRINTSHQSQPHGGWGYAIPEGPVLSSDKIGEPGLRDLLKQIRTHRASNGMPAGDPEHDVAMVYAKDFPWLIKEVADEEPDPNYAEEWIHATWRSFPMGMAEIRSRDDRFAQCEKCVHFEKLDLETLTDEASRRLVLMNPGKSRTEHGWCQLRGWIPSVAVQIFDPWKLADWTKKVEECWLDSTPKKLDK